MKSLSLSLIILFDISLYLINRFNIIVSNCFIVNFFWTIIIDEYLMNLFIIIDIKLYCIFMIEFFDLNNLMIKFIVISFHDDFDDFLCWISSYLTCVLCLFLWQLKHFLMYVSTCCLMLRNWHVCRKNYNVLNIFKWFCNNSSWCFLMISSILFFDICNFFLIKNCFWSFFNTRTIALNSR